LEVVVALCKLILVSVSDFLTSLDHLIVDQLADIEEWHQLATLELVTTSKRLFFKILEFGLVFLRTLEQLLQCGLGGTLLLGDLDALDQVGSLLLLGVGQGGRVDLDGGSRILG
jgi:hypothetical protein